MESGNLEIKVGEIESLESQLAGCRFCPSCGWMGPAPQIETFMTTKVVGTGAAVGGSGVAVAGAAGMGAGMIVLLLGLAANVLGVLCFVTIVLIPIGVLLEVLGVICDVIGGIMLSVGGTAASVGSTVAVAGGISANQAHRKAKLAASAPIQCPECSNFGVIPANSPVALGQIQGSQVLMNRVGQKALSKQASRDGEGLPEQPGLEAPRIVPAGPDRHAPVVGDTSILVGKSKWILAAVGVVVLGLVALALHSRELGARPAVGTPTTRPEPQVANAGDLPRPAGTPKSARPKGSGAKPAMSAASADAFVIRERSPKSARREAPKAAPVDSFAVKE